VRQHLLAFEIHSTDEQRQELLATGLAHRVVGVHEARGVLFFAEESVLLAIHAQRGNLGEVDLRPALRTHVRLGDVELLPEAREHPAVLGGILRAPEQELANLLVGVQGLAVLPTLRRGILRTKGDRGGSLLFERRFQLEQVTAELLRKERPDLRVQRAVLLRALEQQRQQVLPVPVFRDEMHEVQDHVGKAPVQEDDELVKHEPLGLPSAAPPALESQHEEVLHHVHVR
jgi:hypothetical protein